MPDSDSLPAGHQGPDSFLRRCAAAFSHCLIAGILLLSAVSAGAETPVARHGRLRVQGNQLVDRHNQPVCLAGNSFYPSNTGWGGAKYYNAGVVSWLASDWGSSIVRAAMGVEEKNGYLDDPQGNQARVEALVEAATQAGLYVIVDFHSFEAHKHQAAAIRFFQEIATKYGKSENIIYEIYNEPMKVSWSGTVKPYSEALVAAIRAIDPNNLIVLGSPHWDQDVDIAAQDPVAGVNLAYSLHFYAGEHKQSLRDKAIKAMNLGLALFITEWGSVNPDGQGPVSTAEADAWMDFARKHKLSHCVFSICDKVESTSILHPGAKATGNWTPADLTASGTYARSVVRGWSGRASPATLDQSAPPARPAR